MQNVKIAIVNNDQVSFYHEWIEFCQKEGIDFKIVSRYGTDIIQETSDCNYVVCPIYQNDYRDMRYGKSVIYSLEAAGKKVFPDFNTIWHFDDKIAQKYLLESIGAPIVPTYIFYTKEEALKWTEETTFPKVFKLKGGAGSSNVKLARTKAEAVKLINLAFGAGFKQYRWKEKLKEEYRKYRMGKATLRDILRPIYLGVFKRHATEFDHYNGKEIGYAYFQEFIPNNKFDIRVCVIGNNAFALKRHTRNNDFRASGSGMITYSKEEIDERCVKIAFETNEALGMQSIAYDFVFDADNNPLIVEISYGFAGTAYKKCEGYWKSDMEWVPEEDFNFSGWMIENLIKGFNYK